MASSSHSHPVPSSSLHEAQKLRSDRLAHAIYGLIVLTATVGELRVLQEDLATAAAVIGAAFLVLVIAHSYSQFVAEIATHERRPSGAFLLASFLDQLAIAVPAAAAIAVLALSASDSVPLELAYNLVIAGATTVLALTGLAIGRHHGRGWVTSAGIGLINVAVGVTVVGVEAILGH